MIIRDKRKVGELGENLACQYLKRNGYKIIGRNFRKTGGEIDIIARDQKNGILVFVEVKTRTGNAFGQPQEAVDFFKQRKLKKAAFAYLNQKGSDCDFQIDVIAILLNYKTRKARIKHYQNAVEESW